MHSTLAGDLEEFRAACRGRAVRHFAPLVPVMDVERRFPEEARPVLAEMGAYGLPFSSAVGGQDGSWLAWAILHEEVARVLPALGIHFQVNTVVAGALLDCATPEQIARTVPALLSGEKVAFFAFTEPATGSDPSLLATRAERTSIGWRITGQKRWITNASHADLGVVFARDPAGDVSLFLIPEGASGVRSAPPTPMLGLRGTGLADLSLDDVEIPEDHLLGTAGGRFATLQRAMTIGKLGLSSMSVGIMSAALDEAVAYANQREQRGHPIIDFQAIHYLIAEMVSRTEACRQLLYWAATCKDQGAEAIAEVASAKLFITQTAVDVCRMAMSVHGVYGIAEGMPIERMFRDAKMYELLEGTSEVQRELVMRAVR
ncbi:MAG TPA: acyl-CoA dehydrogenase family protein [Acidimicrobiales bacterium]|nr:acyl-CoA dehydrogenase family protein [Acidimicrobiales bacterium]